ncbi:acyl-CoA thioesterase [Bailinhaonella thermotolerans]|uniref:Acyl-CoA thioesterase n=1 Tax=Bailinhaonella thermotolerans TaxID=1070861 RepID=A0A3A4AWV0_9ACTN|nr:thioesterase family protein [Bailinhaonella thermotolerans]RJL32767.1 acyl-CoA thioesterase [Bailinhaonella thermotolerans]
MTQIASPGGHDGVYAQPIRPRFFEIDSQGVMFNMWYLAYVDDAVTGFFEARGLPYERWPELGFDVHVVHAELDWKDGITVDDRPEILIGTARIGGKSFALDFAFRRDGTATCTGQVVYVAVARDGSGSIPLPAPLTEALGEPAPLR